MGARLRLRSLASQRVQSQVISFLTQGISFLNFFQLNGPQDDGQGEDAEPDQDAAQNAWWNRAPNLSWAEDGRGV